MRISYLREARVMKTPTTAYYPHGKRLIIVPAFNEAGSIAHVVQGLAESLPDADIIVIDDGSTDETAVKVPPPARVVTLPFNLGIGGAMQTGFRYAAMHGYDVAVQVDGDGQHPPAEVKRLLEHLSESKCDMVVGSRFLAPSGYPQTMTRMTGIRILRAWIRLLSGKTITDCTSGFRAVNRHVISAFAHWYPDDYPEPEVIMLLARCGYRIEEIPVRMEERTTGQTSIPFFRGLFYVIKVIVALLLDVTRQPWPRRHHKSAANE